MATNQAAVAAAMAATQRATDALRLAARKQPSADEQFRTLENKARRGLAKALAVLAKGEHRPTGAVEEYSQEISRSRHLTMSNSIWMPHSLPMRELTQAGTAGFLTATKVLAAKQFTQPVPVTAALGAQILAADDAIVIPKVTAPSTATMLSTESAAASTSNQTLGQSALIPRTAAAYSEVSGLLLKQSSAQAVISQDLYRAIYSAVDRQCLVGSGGNGDALGIMNIPQANQFSGASLALAGLLGAQTSVGDTLNTSGAFVTNRATAAILRARAEFAGSTKTLYEGGLGRGTIVDQPALTTSELPNGSLIFGSWNWAILALWSQIEVAINPFGASNFQAGIVGIRALCTFDFSLVWPGAFSVSSNVT
jgi:HK97 family phage major capsid protein